MGAKDELRDSRGSLHATRESAEAATERFAKDDASRAAREQAETAARRQHLEQSLEARYVAAGGSREEFAKVKSDLVQRALGDAALTEDDSARRANAARYGR